MKQNKSQQKVRSNIRAFLYLVAFGSIIFAGFLLIRVYFLELEGAEILGIQLPELPKQDSRVEISGVDTTLSSENSEVWGEGIEDIFKLPSDNPWVIVRQSGAGFVGEIINSEFNSVFTVPGIAENITPYQNGYLTYTVPSTNVGKAQLYSVSPSQGIEKLVELPSGWDFNGVTFNTSDRSFYYSRVDLRGNSAIERLTPTKQPLEVYAASGTLIRLVNVGKSSKVEVAVGTGSKICGIIDLESKQLRELSCNGINWTRGDKNYVISGFEPLIYSPGDSSRVMSAQGRNGNLETVTQGSSDEFFSLASKNLDKLAYLVKTVSTPDEVEAIPELLQSFITIIDLQNSTSQDIEIDELEDLLEIGVWSTSLTVIDRGDVLQRLLTHEIPSEEGDLEWKEVVAPGCEIGCDFEFINYETVLYEAP